MHECVVVAFDNEVGARVRRVGHGVSKPRKRGDDGRDEATERAIGRQVENITLLLCAVADGCGDEKAAEHDARGHLRVSEPRVADGFTTMEVGQRRENADGRESVRNLRGRC